MEDVDDVDKSVGWVPATSLDVPHAVAFAITVVLLSRSDTLLAAVLVLNIDEGVAAAWHIPICM